MARKIGALLLLVVVSAVACHHPDQYVVGPDNIDGILALSAAQPTITADGFSRTTITATVDPRTSTANRTVTFKTSLGTLYAPAKSGNTIDVPITSEGTAIVQLESTKTTGVARVDAAIGTVSRAIEVTFAAGNAADILSIEASSPTVPADGSSFTRVIAYVSPNLPDSRRTVEFTTNVGSFGPEGDDLKTFSIKADSSNRAVAVLRSPQTTGLAHVRAVVDDHSAETTVRFVGALPERIVVAADEPTVSADGTDTVIIRAKLLRDIGKVSVGTPVEYSAVDANGQDIGLFSQATLSAADGGSTATFRPGTTPFRGRVTISVRVPGTSVVGTTVIEIVD
jgi:hypothetical protein